jgi:type II secretory pathway pseudopilin PulG
MTNVFAAIVGLGSIAALVLWLFRRYGSKDAKRQKLKNQLEELRKEMRQALLDGRNYQSLLDKREQLLKRLSNLR